MAKVKGRGNRSTEVKLAGILRRNGIKGWRRHLPLQGKPDFAFHAEKLVIFVDGCFWHGCPKHCSIPVKNHAYWANKISRNRSRDRKNNRILRENGWTVIRIWEHSLKYETRILSRLRRYLNIRE